MSNMSYCRFRNTLPNLRDCLRHFDDIEISGDEKEARIEMYNICKEIADNFEREDLE